MATKSSALRLGGAFGEKPQAVTRAAEVPRVNQGNPNHAIADPRRAQPADILALQRLMGNQAVTSLLARASAPRVQATLMVGAADDPYEHEAERMANQVMRMTAPGGTRVSASRASPGLEAQLAASRGAGSSLPDETREFMESRFGADFSHVRVHTGDDAAQWNREIDAQAFTYGHDIYFGEGSDDIASSRGKHLLAHELAHVIQQTGGDQPCVSALRIQRFEKVGPAGALSTGKGRIQGQKVPAYKKLGEARTETNAIGHFSEDPDSTVFILKDSVLAEGTHLFVYGTFDYVKGGSGEEYVWVETSHVTIDQVPKVDPARPAPGKQVGQDDASAATPKHTWRSIGNLRGHPPVRTEHPHNINVVEDESHYTMLLGLAESALDSITGEADKMNPTGTSVVDNRFWFAKVYQFVTEGEIDFVTSNTFYYPSYVTAVGDLFREDLSRQPQRGYEGRRSALGGGILAGRDRRQ